MTATTAAISTLAEGTDRLIRKQRLALVLEHAAVRLVGQRDSRRRPRQAAGSFSVVGASAAVAAAPPATALVVGGRLHYQQGFALQRQGQGEHVLDVALVQPDRFLEMPAASGCG
jgi:hypothetical protein